MAVFSQERNKTEHRDAAILLYNNSSTGIFVTLFAASFLVFSHLTDETATFKYLWLAVLYFLSFLRGIDFFRWKKINSDDHYDGKKAVNRYVTGALSTGSLLAIYCIYVIQFANNAELSLIILTISALAGGATSVLAAHKLTAIFYSGLLLGPASLVLLLSESDHHNLLGILGTAYCLAMIITANKAADFTSLAIRLKNENAVLVSQMEVKVEQRTKKIYELSNLDPLTGLFNRAAFMHHLEQHLTSNSHAENAVALLFIDLDGFKNINDTLGHETGDQVLQQTAKRLSAFSGEQHLLCRWGGDEFLIALTGADKKTASDYAQIVIDRISEYYQFERNRFSIGATIGIALLPEHSVVGNELIQLADTAMYYQKKSHPGTVGLFDEEMRAHLIRQKRLKEGLSKALEAKQLHMQYQPIVCAVSQQVVSFEALLRWDFAGENVSPDEFITIAEQFGLIEEIGTWVLQQSCFDASQWLKESNTIQPSVSVNVSVLQLLNANFIDIIKSALSTTHLASEKLTIEITESILSNDKEKIIQHVKALQSLNIKVSIDDFGTEYSSLSVIQDLAADTLKIDRTFVNKLDSTGLPIIEAVKKMASSLNYSVIAEGIETQNQADLLAELGIEMLQGFYFSKPLNQSHIKGYIEQQSSCL